MITLSRRCFALLMLGTCLMSTAASAEPELLKIGIIGLDTSHAPAFTKAFNADPADPEMQNCRVVAAYPYGSQTIESSSSRIPKYTEELRGLGVDIVDSIDELLKRVDCVLLETNDGQLHRAQAQQVIDAGKPMFIDKPVAANLTDTLAIYKLAAEKQVPIFSSSSLRYTDGAQAIRRGDYGDVLGCATYSPCKLEPSHTDLYWYGIHGVESLYTCMGPGCESVTRTSSEDFELVVGKWADGRIGTFRGIRKGKSGYGGTAFTTEAVQAVGTYQGYRPLVVQIAKFFRSGKPPIDAEETIELYAFMQAADESKRQGGAPVRIADVLQQAQDEL
ncbi:Oxidoreductase family, NAD-binding Rossmann fold [Roseimaritima ulvae]|uniref:Oxidoreductase family, NAD-binding Rossmann fold n=2 Tax=Roseimaritima ulvae TaxID=980254 RepID=A0A5B9QY92_9BACT|nr:Oxidoreductase family, NAD-binding Rossmann fold [Roseimaritima ulvae]